MWLVISTLILKQGLIMATGSDMHCKCSNISEMVQGIVICTTYY